jgi:hypothetical protein
MTPDARTSSWREGDVPTDRTHDRILHIDAQKDGRGLCLYPDFADWRAQAASFENWCAGQRQCVALSRTSLRTSLGKPWSHWYPWGCAPTGPNRPPSRSSFHSRCGSRGVAPRASGCRIPSGPAMRIDPVVGP